RAVVHRIPLAARPDVGHAVRGRSRRGEARRAAGDRERTRLLTLLVGRCPAAHTPPHRGAAAGREGRVADAPPALARAAMRRMGHRVVDLRVERIASLREGPPLQPATPADMASRIDGPPPAEGVDFETALDRLATDVLPFVGHFDHPRFFGYI